MAVQTSYQDYLGDAYVGMLADMQNRNIISKVNNTTAVIPFGRPVFTDGDSGMQAATTTSTAAQFIGITMRELNRAFTDAEITAGIGAVPERDGAVLTVGCIWVAAAVAVAKDDPVYVVLSTGLFTNVAGDSGTTIQITNAKFVSTAAAGALSKISLVNGG